MSASATCQPESPLLGACASFDFQIQIPRAHAAGFDAAEANALRVLVDMRTPLGAPRAPPQSSSSSRNHKRAKPLLLHVEDLGNENAPSSLIRARYQFGFVIGIHITNLDNP